MTSLARLPTLAPLELLTLPEALDGKNGTNRANMPHAQIAAQTDVDALKVWLARYVDTKTTFESYRKEAERLLLWTTIERGKPLSSLDRKSVV